MLDSGPPPTSNPPASVVVLFCFFLLIELTLHKGLNTDVEVRDIKEKQQEIKMILCSEAAAAADCVSAHMRLSLKLNVQHVLVKVLTLPPPLYLMLPASCLFSHPPFNFFFFKSRDTRQGFGVMTPIVRRKVFATVKIVYIFLKYPHVILPVEMYLFNLDSSLCIKV